MTTPSVATRLSFLAASAAMTLAVFASATTLAGIEREAAIAHLAQAASAAQARMLVVAATTNPK